MLKVKQEDVLFFVEDFMEENSQYPSVKDIREGTNINDVSTRTILRQLVKTGYLEEFEQGSLKYSRTLKEIPAVPMDYEKPKPVKRGFTY